MGPSELHGLVASALARGVLLLPPWAPTSLRPRRPRYDHVSGSVLSLEAAGDEPGFLEDVKHKASGVGDDERGPIFSSG
jgi:hypothetical protein